MQLVSAGRAREALRDGFHSFGIEALQSQKSLWFTINTLLGLGQFNFIVLLY